MNIKLLTEHHLELLSLTEGCSSESIHVKMPHCWKSHVTDYMCSHHSNMHVQLYSRVTGLVFGLNPTHIHTLCLRAAKTLVILYRCAGIFVHCY